VIVVIELLADNPAVNPSQVKHARFANAAQDQPFFEASYCALQGPFSPRY